ncbi:alcohol dehydrogenase catalytic domain-containing protein [Streptomyces acidicola]|uniref:alcohol dehydrogenase catalytic domain-containing protein n=1 Tax=Streptomyces acidicola TaxID=2596892 RepID=UPI003802A8CD
MRTTAGQEPIVPFHLRISGGDLLLERVGDRVGVGCMVDSCSGCDNCPAGQEQFCRNGFAGTYGGVDRDGSVTQGGYATHFVVDEHFVLRVPDGIPFEAASSLMCAGITTNCPLRRWNASPGAGLPSPAWAVSGTLP